MTDPILSHDQIREAFRQLGDRLAQRGVVADVYVVGGAAMALAYDSRRATRDIDAVFVPHGIVRAEAEKVAAELGLPNWWLNDQASVYVSGVSDADASLVFDHPGLRVMAASAEHLLAMKVLAGRRRDLDDILFLINRIGITSYDDVVTLVAQVFPDEQIPPRTKLMLEDVFDN